MPNARDVAFSAEHRPDKYKLRRSPHGEPPPFVDQILICMLSASPPLAVWRRRLIEVGLTTACPSIAVYDPSWFSSFWLELLGMTIHP